MNASSEQDADTGMPRSRTLVQQVADLNAAIISHREAREKSRLSTALQNRLDSLTAPANDLGALGRSVALLRVRGLPSLDRKTTNRLEKLGIRLAKVLKEFAADPGSIVSPNAVPEAELAEAQRFGEDQCLEFWKNHVIGALPGDGALTAFEKHPRWTPIVQRIRQLKLELATVSRNLPTSQKVIDAIDTKVELAKAEFARLPGLSEKLRRFLQQTVSPGVPLRDILEDREILEWVKDQHMDQELRVTSGQGSVSRTEQP